MSASNSFLVVGGVLAVIAIIAGVLLWRPYSDQILLADYTGAPTTTAADVGVFPSVSGTSQNGISPILYNGETFSPRILIVNRGETVHFINRSNLAMRINAERTSTTTQPNHYVQSESVGRGGEYELSFVDAGVWIVTNLNDLSGEGIVVVYVR